MAVSLKEAFNLIEKNRYCTTEQIVPIEDSIGSISYENIKAVYPNPKFNNSAIDGFGVKISDGSKEVKITDTIYFADDKTPVIVPSQAIKIQNGARVPNSVEAIIPKELVEFLDEETIKLPKNIKENSNINFIGEDIEKDETLVHKGDKINFSKITLLSMQGITHIKVYKKPKVLVVSSSEKRKLHYENIKDHQIYNSTLPTFLARFKELNCDVSFTNIKKDTKNDIKEICLKSLDYDLIITNIKDPQIIKTIFKESSIKTIFKDQELNTIFGIIETTFIINICDDILSSTVVFEIFVKTILQQISGSNKPYLNYIKAVTKYEIVNKTEKPNIIFGYYNGKNFKASKQISKNMINAHSKCNSFIILGKNQQLKKGEMVNILPTEFDFFTSKQKDILTYGKQ